MSFPAPILNIVRAKLTKGKRRSAETAVASQTSHPSTTTRTCCILILIQVSLQGSKSVVGERKRAPRPNFRSTQGARLRGRTISSRPRLRLRHGQGFGGCQPTPLSRLHENEKMSRHCEVSQRQAGRGICFRFRRQNSRPLRPSPATWSPPGCARCSSPRITLDPPPEANHSSGSRLMPRLPRPD